MSYVDRSLARHEGALDAERAGPDRQVVLGCRCTACRPECPHARLTTARSGVTLAWRARGEQCPSCAQGHHVGRGADHSLPPLPVGDDPWAPYAGLQPLDQWQLDGNR